MSGKRRERARHQLEAAIGALSSLLPDKKIEIAHNKLGTYLRYEGDPTIPSAGEQLTRMVDEMAAGSPGEPSKLSEFETSGGAFIVLGGFEPWVPFLPGRLRARLTAEDAFGFIIEFVDQRVGSDGWPGGGHEAKVTIRNRILTPRLVPSGSTGKTLLLPAISAEPFYRRSR